MMETAPLLTIGNKAAAANELSVARNEFVPRRCNLNLMNRSRACERGHGRSLVSAVDAHRHGSDHGNENAGKDRVHPRHFELELGDLQ